MKKVFLKCEKYIISKLGEKANVAITEIITSYYFEQIKKREMVQKYSVSIHLNGMLFGFECEKLEQIYELLIFEYLKYIAYQ